MNSSAEFCDDMKDNDKDDLVDCADSDCADSLACRNRLGDEASNDKCTDWVDNDQDGFIDCDDSECHAPGVTACKGSWDKL